LNRIENIIKKIDAIMVELRKGSFALFLLILTAITMICNDVFAEDFYDLRKFLIPIPKEIQVDGWIDVLPKAVCIKSNINFPSAYQIFDSIRGLELKACEPRSDLNGESSRYEIFLVIADNGTRKANIKGDIIEQDFERLRALPNADQAYIIRTEKNRMLVLALTLQGIHNGLITLHQIVDKSVKEGNKNTPLRLPIMMVIDWPDIPERGFWGHGYTIKEFNWFKRYKLNLIELSLPNLIRDMGIDNDGKGWVKLDVNYIEAANKDFIKIVPIIFHLDQLHKGSYPSLKDMYVRFPGLRAQCTFRSPSEVYPCAASEGFIRVLVGWLREILENPMVTDVCVWLSEWDKTACNCNQCRTLGRQKSEAKGVAAAWEEVLREHSGKHLWILPYVGCSDDVKSVIPKDKNIHVVEYNYKLKLGPLIPEGLTRSAHNGEWIGVYPLFAGASDRFFPSHLAGLIRERMAEFHQKNVRKVAGYTGLSSLGLHKYNMAAAAEWAWNGQNRSVKEFAFAFGHAQEMSYPDKFAEWVDLIEPIEQRLQGIQYARVWLEDEKDKEPKFERGPLWGYKNFLQMKQDYNKIGLCQRLAEELGELDIIRETGLINSYLKLLMLYAGINEELKDRRGTANTLGAKIDDAVSDINSTLTLYYDHLGNSAERWFLIKSKNLLIEDLQKIQMFIKTRINIAEPANIENTHRP